MDGVLVKPGVYAFTMSGLSNTQATDITALQSKLQCEDIIYKASIEGVISLSELQTFLDQI